MFEVSNYRFVVFCILVIVQFFSSDIKSQTYSNTTPYKIKIIDSPKGNNKGILYSVTDSTLIIISELDYYRFFKNNLEFQKTTISFYQIDKIKISKKNHFWRSFGITTLAGATIGTILGYSSGDSHSTNGYAAVGLTAKEKAGIMGVGGTLIGAATGIVIGLIQINIPINKKYISFSRKKEYLAKRSLLH